MTSKLSCNMFLRISKLEKKLNVAKKASNLDGVIQRRCILWKISD